MKAKTDELSTTVAPEAVRETRSAEGSENGPPEGEPKGRHLRAGKGSGRFGGKVLDTLLKKTAGLFAKQGAEQVTEEQHMSRPGRLASRLSLRLRSLKYPASRDLETLEALQTEGDEESQDQPTELTSSSTLKTGHSVETLATPRFHSGTLLPRFKLLRSTSSVSSGILAPVALTMSDEDGSQPEKKAPSADLGTGKEEGGLSSSEEVAKATDAETKDSGECEQRTEGQDESGVGKDADVQSAKKAKASEEGALMPLEPMQNGGNGKYVAADPIAAEEPAPAQALEKVPGKEEEDGQEMRYRATPPLSPRGDTASPLHYTLHPPSGSESTAAAVAAPLDASGVLSVCREALEKLKGTMEELEQENERSMKRGFDDLFDKIRRERTPFQKSMSAMATATLSVNHDKNRYTDVLPYETCRVVLDGPDRSVSDGTDYINASHIEAREVIEGGTAVKLEGLPKYIAAQGPLESTIADFWEMTIQQKCVAVVMVAREFEGNKPKCAHYFPTEAGVSEVYQHMKVTTKSKDPLLGAPEVVKRELVLEDLRAPDRGAYDLVHFHYAEWPDHGIPEDTSSMRVLMRLLRKGEGCCNSMGPFVVHCSAGIGRTGTYCTVDYTLRRVLAGDASAVNIPDTVRQLRTQRPGMVQTKDQFFFCYQAVKDELEEIVASGVVE